MSVIVRGMEMPTSCSSCPLLEGDKMDGLCHAASKWLDDEEYWTWYVYPEGDIDDSMPCNCPLVPVPPHGRLIDADALKTMWDDEIARLLEKGIEYLDYHVDTLFSDFKHDVDKMPTIIEAEGET